MFLLFQQTFHNVFYVKYSRYFGMFNAIAISGLLLIRDYYENYIQYNMKKLIFLHCLRPAFTIRYCEYIIIFRHVFIYVGNINLA